MTLGSAPLETASLSPRYDYPSSFIFPSSFQALSSSSDAMICKLENAISFCEKGRLINVGYFDDDDDDDDDLIYVPPPH